MFSSFFRRKPESEATAASQQVAPSNVESTFAPPVVPEPEPVEEVPAGPTLDELLARCAAEPQNADLVLQAAQRAHEEERASAAVTAMLRTANALADVDTASAIKVLKKLKDIGEDTVESHYLCADLHRMQRQLREAEQEIRAVLRADLNNLHALGILADLNIQDGRPNDAVLVCNKMISIDPRDPIAREKLGDAYALQNVKDDAVKAWLMAAMHFVRMGEKEEALRLYGQVLEIDPSNPTAFREQANLSAS